jgi:hypothetical protein
MPRPSHSSRFDYPNNPLPLHTQYNTKTSMSHKYCKQPKAVQILQTTAVRCKLSVRKMRSANSITQLYWGQATVIASVPVNKTTAVSSTVQRSMPPAQRRCVATAGVGLTR